MLKFIIRRLMVIFPMVLLVITLTWVLIRLAPGNFYSQPKALPAAVEKNIRAKYGLDKPWYVQYGKTMWQILGGDFGFSRQYPEQTVNEILARALPVSATIGLAAYLIALVTGLFFGTVAALKQNSSLDYSSMAAAMLGISVPNFVLGPILVLVFALTLYWLPAARWDWLVEFGPFPWLKYVLWGIFVLLVLGVAAFSIYRFAVHRSSPDRLVEDKSEAASSWVVTAIGFVLGNVILGLLALLFVKGVSLGQTGVALPVIALVLVILAVIFGLWFARRSHSVLLESLVYGIIAAAVPPLLALLVRMLSGLFQLTAQVGPFGIPRFRYIILPAITLAAVYMAYIARLTRAGMLEVLRKDYIRTARAKGLKERAVIIRHAMRGGILPVVSYTGPALAFLVGGTVVVERIFALPGLGNYLINAALNRDEPLLLGITAFISTIILLFNLLVDIAYAYIDPRIRYS
ncbi:MAG TPA: ABC transporter permease subunit [Pyrinomonadaceae bacterium]|jgi:ABC-type dipeptide/oligopeptide/nickel transport system permease component